MDIFLLTVGSNYDFTSMKPQTRKLFRSCSLLAYLKFMITPRAVVSALISFTC